MSKIKLKGIDKSFECPSIDAEEFVEKNLKIKKYHNPETDESDVVMTIKFPLHIARGVFELDEEKIKKEKLKLWESNNDYYDEVHHLHYGIRIPFIDNLELFELNILRAKQAAIDAAKKFEKEKKIISDVKGYSSTTVGNTKTFKCGTVTQYLATGKIVDVEALTNTKRTNAGMCPYIPCKDIPECEHI